MKIWKLDDYIDTDAIMPAKYLNDNDPTNYAKHCLEDTIPHFGNKVKKGDVLIAGKYFGYGSSRESAPNAIKILGIQAVFALSFGRIFFRNSINIGLPVIQVNEIVLEKLMEAKEIYIEEDFSEFHIFDGKQRETFSTNYTSFVRRLLQDGGLLNYLQKEQI